MTQNVHSARSFVKSKCTTILCTLHGMKDFDDKPEPAKRLTQARMRKGYRHAKAAAEAFGWSPHTYIQHENGTRGYDRAADQYAKAFGVTVSWLLHGEGSINQKTSIDRRIALLPVEEQKIYYKSFNDLLDARLGRDQK